MIINRYVNEIKTPQSAFEKMKISSSRLAAEMLRQAESLPQTAEAQKSPQDNAR